MAYNEKLEVRIVNALSEKKGIVVKKMFGGVVFMLKDKMFSGIIKDDLMVRVLPEKFEPLLKKPYARVMEFGGRKMRGFICIEPQGIKTAKQLAGWLELGIENALLSPPKKPKKKKSKK